ncbi:MAG: hypothetical protein C4292_03645 [Nitrososphaera sp.]
MYGVTEIEKRLARIVIADKDTYTIRLTEIVRNSNQYNNKDSGEQQIWHELLFGDVIADCLLTDIQRKEDPLYHEVRWQFGAITSDGRYHRYGPAPLKVIFERMGDDNQIVKRQAPYFDVFSTLLKAYQQAGKVKITREVKSPGFYIIDDDYDDDDDNDNKGNDGGDNGDDDDADVDVDVDVDVVCIIGIVD